jgi:hypothetical protein
VEVIDAVLAFGQPVVTLRLFMSGMRPERNQSTDKRECGGQQEVEWSNNKVNIKYAHVQIS